MKPLKTLVLFLCLAVLPALTYGQSAAAISKLLTKSAKSVLKSPIPIPGLDLAKSGAKGAALSDAVNSGIGSAMKEAKKMGLWSLDGLNPSQLTEIATSDSPFSSLLSMKGNNVYKDFSNLINDGLKGSGAGDLLGNMAGVPGFEMPGGGKEGLTRSITESTLSQLDKSASGLLKDLKM